MRVLIFICPDIGSVPWWMCLIWPGCGFRLRSEDRTPETQSPETCCVSTTPFSSNTQVIHRPYKLNCTLLEVNIISCDWFVCVFVSQTVNPGWAPVRFLSWREWVWLAGGDGTTGIHITNSAARGLQYRMVRAHCIFNFFSSPCG